MPVTINPDLCSVFPTSRRHYQHAIHNLYKQSADSDTQAGRQKLTKKGQMMDRQSDSQAGRKAEINTKKDRKDRHSDRQIGRQAET